MEKHNDPMSETGKAAARALIPEIKAIVAQIDAEMARVESALDDLRRQRNYISTQIRRCQSTFARHRDLPSEILSAIFLACNGGNPLWLVCQFEPHTPPWNVSQVCRKWRSVALDTPDLWRHIFITPKNPVRSIAELISRGGNGRISMQVRGQFPKAFWDFVIANLSNFWKLDITHNPFEMEPLLLSMPAGNAGALESFSMFGGYRCQSKRLACLESAPSLRELILPSWPLSISSLSRLPLATITTFNILLNPLKSDEVFTILSQCLSIVKCDIGVHEAVILPIKSRSLTLPYLEHFTINACQSLDASFPSFLPNLVMPRLTAFKLFQSGNTSARAKWRWPTELTLAIIRSGCLKSLYIPLPTLSTADFDILLPATLGIRSFEPSSATLSIKALEGVASGQLLAKVEGKEFDFPWAVQSMDALDLILDVIEKRGWYLRLTLDRTRQWNSHDPVVRRMYKMHGTGKLRLSC